MDVLPLASQSQTTFYRHVDPEIESFELVAIYPVECVNLSIFRRKKRQSLKVLFCDNRISYFELGGFENRKMFWNLWCERVRFLSPNEPSSSKSETSVVTSTSHSTIYMVEKTKTVSEDGKMQIWCRFGASEKMTSTRWTERYLYAEMSQQDQLQRQQESQKMKEKDVAKRSSASLPQPRKSSKVFRFGCNIPEKCISGLILEQKTSSNPPSEPIEEYRKNSSYFDLETLLREEDVALAGMQTTRENVEFNSVEVAEASVVLWERRGRRRGRPLDDKSRHGRKYAFCPKSDFIFGFGPLQMSRNEAFSVQIKRVASMIDLGYRSVDNMFVPKNQLCSTISFESLRTVQNHLYNLVRNSLSSQSHGATYFWTSNYWYRPRPNRIAYRELCETLTSIKEHHIRKMGVKALLKCKKSYCLDKLRGAKRPGTKSTLHILHKSRKRRKQEKHCKTETDKSLAVLEELLSSDLELGVWNFDADTLAHQLTMIDKELFMKIPQHEIEELPKQKYAPNIQAMIAFSHRISCLFTSEILDNGEEKMRARMITRLIKAAIQCDKMCSMQSCKSILNALQSVPIYRLHKTWSYVRKKHGRKYREFENLCHTYKDPRTKVYCSRADEAALNPPFIPYMGDVLARLLDKVPQSEAKQSASFSRKKIKKWYAFFKRAKKQGIQEEDEDTADREKANENEVLEMFGCWQRGAADFRMAQHPLAREFLLKSKYREDMANFFVSLLVETSSSDDLYRNKY